MQADLDCGIARSHRLPRLSAAANAIYMAPSMDMQGMDFVMHGAWTAGLSLTQPIYTGGKITAGVRLSQIGREAAQEQVRASEAQVIADADNAYWTYLSVLQKEDMLMSLLCLVDTTYAQVEAAVAVDMATRADLLRIEAKRSQLHYQLEKVRNGIDLCRMGICSMVGVPLDTPIALSDTAMAIASPASIALAGDGIADRPEYQLLEHQVRASQQQIKLARADFLPTVALSGMYNFYGNMQLKGMAPDDQGGYTPYTSKINDNFGMLVLSVNVPLLNWGEGSKKVKRQRLALENSRLELDKNSRLMEIQLANSRHSLWSAYSMISTAQSSVDQAAEALRVMQDRFEVGMCTLTDLLEAQSQWHQSQADLIEARAQYQISQTEYLQAAGRLSPR